VIAAEIVVLLAGRGDVGGLLDQGFVGRAHLVERGGQLLERIPDDRGRCWRRIGAALERRQPAQRFRGPNGEIVDSVHVVVSASRTSSISRMTPSTASPASRSGARLTRHSMG